MPLVKVSLLKGKSREEKGVLLDAIHAALIEAFKIPENDRNQRIFEFEPENFDVPERKTSNYTLIEIVAFPGRSLNAKRKIYQAVVQNLKELEIQPIDILIVLKEPPLDNWGVRGGGDGNKLGSFLRRHLVRQISGAAPHPETIC